MLRNKHLIHVCMQILCDPLRQPMGTDVTDCDVISARNPSKAVDCSIMSLASDTVNNMLVYGSRKHDSRHLLIGQNLEVKRPPVLHNE